MNFNDRREKNDAKMAKDMLKGATINRPASQSRTAKCGHEDPLGYFSGTVCGKCARKNHKKAMGR